MLLLILIILGEFFSSPAIALADGYTLSLVADQPKDVKTFFFKQINKINLVWQYSFIWKYWMGLSNVYNGYWFRLF